MKGMTAREQRSAPTYFTLKPITIHPDVSGRPHVLMMPERLYHHVIGHPGVRFVTMNEMADDFARRSPRKR
jgi:hypothetical protein